MIGLPSLRVRCAAAAALAAVLWLSGCENRIEYARYPKDLHYPTRTDPLVVERPKSELFAPMGPGHLDDEITRVADMAKTDPSAAGKTFDPGKLDSKDRKALTDAVEKLFGTPRSPQVGPSQPDKDLADQLIALKLRDADAKAPFATLAHGSQIYRYHCLHCHGLSGDGRGPTGPWLNPHPRDYRQGTFKFISTDSKLADRKPRREDLLRTLHNGIESTSMPSFTLLGDEDLNALASYVMHLSIRGEVEFKLIVNKLQDQSDIGSDSNNPDSILADIVKDWADSDAQPSITPDPKAYDAAIAKGRPASIRHGYELVSDMKGPAGCIACHADYGRQVKFRYDNWGTLVRPMNLTAGVYRGGRRPIDLFWRIKGGVAPSGMPATGLKEDRDIWDVVNFVQALPYPQMLPPDVREKVYGAVGDKEKPTAERAQR